ncbi:MAG TPA: tetratricopeptide repeat protein [Myxococcota bacterium]|nr:tetratricopeptide repeat protein [Myxococcota bacterium]
MRSAHRALLPAAVLAAACAGTSDRHTLASLRDAEPDMTEVRVEGGLEQAMQGYRRYLDEAPESSLTPEAMRRLADLKLEKEFGILGDGEIVELPAPEPERATSPDARAKVAPAGAKASESEEAFERRAAGAASTPAAKGVALELPGTQKAAAPSGPQEAIELYDKILATYPDYPRNDEVLYQKSRAFDELGRTDEAIAVMERLIAAYPRTPHLDEVQFRRGEYFFTRKKYLDAEKAYSAITAMGPGEYYELALYKLGWTFYKQDMHEEALNEYTKLLDYKVSVGYDFDQSTDEDSERRVADTFRVISLSFSSLGGPEVLESYFAGSGHRSYEDRIYSHLGEFYLEKLRYADAAKAYKAFVALNPLHRSAPKFSMRVVEIYDAGDFPKLVLEARKEFAANYGLQAEYWRHFDVKDSPDVLAYLRQNLEDLANHYHALYQNADLADEKPANFDEAARWYRAYLASFPKEADSSAINYRLADLLLENQDFADASREYERTAYEYPAHERAAAAGYAAIYAHRERLKRTQGDDQLGVKREAVTSTLRFVDAFPQHDRAAAVLGAAVDDLYELKDYALAISTGQRLISGYPGAEPPIQRAAWLVVAHASFDTGAYPQAEQAYGRVLEMTDAGDASRQGVVDNLAASIYKQGEQASAAANDRAAADNFLRVATAAPESKIRPLAEYDAANALIRLKDWAGAAEVLEAFRQAHPDHALVGDATRQLAFVHREAGKLSEAAAEYERIAAESPDAEMRREALLEAGSLYESAQQMERARAAYVAYVRQFPEPLEPAVETRSKIAALAKAAQDDAGYRAELQQIVALDAAAGGARTPRVHYLAAQSAQVLSEDAYHRFTEVKLVQPFEKSLKEKKRRMDAALDGFGALVDYEVGDVTAAATFYMAEVYLEFSRALMASERPADLQPGEVQDYDMALEEQAFPFEERAIEVHAKNLELMREGVYNAWIEKSLARLAELSPGRYAKQEASSGWLTSLDRYAYEPPKPPAPPVAETPVVIETAAPAEPAPAPAEAVAPQTEAVAPPAAGADE